MTASKPESKFETITDPETIRNLMEDTYDLTESYLRGAWDGLAEKLKEA